MLFSVSRMQGSSLKLFSPTFTKSQLDDSRRGATSAFHIHSPQHLNGINSPSIALHHCARLAPTLIRTTLEMEDQFGGRTDDGLFDDDFEPVESEPVVSQEPVQEPAQEPEPVVDEKPAPAQPKPAPTAQATRTIAPGLASSRYADPPTDPVVAPAPAPAPSPAQQPPPSAQPPADAPSGPKKKGQSSTETAAVKQARLGSGANPRQKLTEDELSAKMEKMKLLNAEKTRKFEKAEQDEKQHREALARGREEQRKRRLEAEERRKRTEENQKQLNSEREKNRERKMKAMGLKEGGWDEGKEERAEEENRRGFKGANGGIRGARQGGRGGRHARDGEDPPDVDRFLDDRSRGRGRGRGRGNGSRGQGAAGGAADRPQPKKQAVPTQDEFPALPADGTPKPEAQERPKPISVPSYPPKMGGRWDEEVEEEEMKSGNGQP